MKLRTTALLAALLLIASLASAQVRNGTWEISPFFGYLWGDDFPAGSNALFANKVDVANHDVFGVSVGYNFNSVFELETRWARSMTHFEAPNNSQVFGTNPVNLGDLTIDYIMGYSTFNFGRSSRFVPFVTVGLGAAILNPGPRLDITDFPCPGTTCSNPSTSTRFTGSIGTGVKIFVDRHFGFKVDGRFYDTYLSSGSCSTFGNGDTHCHNNGSNWLLNWETTGGLVIAF